MTEYVVLAGIGGFFLLMWLRSRNKVAEMKYEAEFKEMQYEIKEKKQAANESESSLKEAFKAYDRNRSSSDSE